MIKKYWQDRKKDVLGLIYILLEKTTNRSVKMSATTEV